jgi:uncharacterized protein
MTSVITQKATTSRGVSYPRGRKRDNVIPLRGSLSGPQLAGWEPGPAVLSGLGCELLADQAIPVADGVSLAGDVYLPKRPGRYPAVLSFGGYSKELHTAGAPTGSNEVGSPSLFTGRGYARVIVTRRGMGRSGGDPDIFFSDQEVNDMTTVIAWLAEQPWCNGDVVMFGTSYYGMVQPRAAVERPPALKAFFCNEICTDYFRHLIQFGGVPAPYFMSLWTGANFTDAMTKLRVPPVVRALVSQVLNSPLKPLWERAVRKRMTSILQGFSKNTPTRKVREWYANWLFDGQTRMGNSIPAGPSGRLDQIDIPFVVVQNLGYFNLHQFGCYDLFENASTKPDRKWLILGPAEYELPVYSWQLEALAFFDHILYGANNGYAEQPPVRYWLEGAETYKAATDFPLPGTTTTQFWLAPGDPSADTHSLGLTPPTRTGSETWAAIPIGAEVVGGLDEVINQTLTYDVTMEKDVELTGPVSAHLRFSSTEIDSHVVARVGRVDLAGEYHLLSLGTIRPARRRVDIARSTASEIAIDTDITDPLTPGEPVDLAFSLTPAPTFLRAGEKLRFDVASRTDLLRSDVSHGHVQFDMQVPPYYSRNSIHYGDASYIELQTIT